MNIQTYQLSLDFEQILNLVRQMPSVEQEKIRQEIEKANREQKTNSFLADFHTDEISLAEITTEVEAVRRDIYIQQHQLGNLLQQLSPERLKVLADFAAYLADAESEAATQELLAIPGLLERVKQNKNKLMPKNSCVNWITLRSDED
jgi:predicted DNA-binding protein YlxM (UPF0122 family)